MATKAAVRANALGVDRLVEIQAEHLPLLPFGAATTDQLAALGIVLPRDPTRPKAPLTGDWSLEVVHTWRMALPAGKTTPVVVKFAPIAAHYHLAKGDEDDIGDLTEELCLKPTP